MKRSYHHTFTRAPGWLPNDIIIDILSQADAERENSPTPWFYTGTNLQPTLFALCLVDKRWNDGATRLLYKDVFIVSSRTLSLLARTLQERQDLRDYVRSFFCARACDEDGKGKSSLAYTQGIQQVYLLCRNLRREKLIHAPDRPQSKNIRVPDARWKELGAGAITCLELRSFDEILVELFKSDVSFPVLEVLTIRGSRLSGRSVAEFRWPVMPRLRRLCLYQCLFWGEHMPLPRSLRALEIVGGDYAIKNFEDEIISIGKSLELLTFMPAYFRAQQHIAPLNKWLRELPLVITLRVAVSFFSPLYPVELPPRLRHFVGAKMSTGSLEGLFAVQAWAARQVESRNSEMTASHLRTIRFIVSYAEVLDFAGKETEEEAEKAGIRFSVVYKTTDDFLEDFFEVEG